MIRTAAKSETRKLLPLPDYGIRPSYSTIRRRSRSSSARYSACWAALCKTAQGWWPFDQDELERRPGDGEVGVAAAALGGLRAEELGVEGDGAFQVGDAEREMDSGVACSSLGAVGQECPAGRFGSPLRSAIKRVRSWATATVASELRPTGAGRHHSLERRQAGPRCPD
jgi:hypothetical protein